MTRPALAGVQMVVMAKRPVPGRVKTRLVDAGLVDAAGAAEIADALLRCTLARLAARGTVVLALDGAGDAGDLARLGDGRRLPVVEQGTGDLGARLDRVWRAVGPDRPVAFFGADAPDVPAAALDGLGPAAREADLALGPTADGGYWTLAAPRHRPEVLVDIDWGGRSVYDQTCRRAARAGLDVQALLPWRDVDRPDDVRSLRIRLSAWMAATPHPAPADRPLAELARRLDRLLA